MDDEASARERRGRPLLGVVLATAVAFAICAGGAVAVTAVRQADASPTSASSSVVQ